MEKSKGFIGEFKTFIMRGNVMDLAIAVIIGGAFQAIVSSLVTDVVMPVISLITGGVDFSKWKIMLGEGADAASINYGMFITAIINFLLMAFVIFCFVKFMNNLAEKVKKEDSAEEEEAPETKVCPYCKSEIPADATRCAHCTSDVSETIA
jgi:large conductance mechanosensitive channel